MQDFSKTMQIFVNYQLQFLISIPWPPKVVNNSCSFLKGPIAAISRWW
jgi:hypothetical protein